MSGENPTAETRESPGDITSPRVQKTEDTPGTLEGDKDGRVRRALTPPTAPPTVPCQDLEYDAEQFRANYKVIFLLLIPSITIWVLFTHVDFRNIAIYKKSSGIDIDSVNIYQRQYRKHGDYREKPRACIVSAMLGGYEKTAKGVKLAGNHSLFMITDENSEEAVRKSSIWSPLNIDPSFWILKCGTVSLSLKQTSLWGQLF